MERKQVSKKRKRETFSIFQKGHNKIAELLIQNGANVNIVGKSNNTALTWAAYKGKDQLTIFTHMNNHHLFIGASIGLDEIVRMLIEKGANVNAVNNLNNTALELAAINGNI